MTRPLALACFFFVVGCGTAGVSRTPPPPPPERAACSNPNAQRPEGLSKGDILAAVKVALPALQQCCEGPATTAELHWWVDCDGTVSNVFIGTDALRDTPAGRCLASTVAAMRFPTHAGPATPPVQIPVPCGQR